MSGLRGYQIDLIANIRAEMAHHRRVLAVLPTGSGKTQTFCSIAQLSTFRNNNVLILVHRAELLEQTSLRLTAMGVHHGLIAPRYQTTHAQIQVASIQAAAKRLTMMPWSPNLILVDEAHHCAARSWRQILEGYPNAHIIGWTATPQRLDGKGLGDSFDAIAEGPPTRRLIELGYLSKYRLYAPPNGADLSNLRKRGGDYRTEQVEERMTDRKVLYSAVQNYMKYAPDRQALAFCASIRHAGLVRDAFIEAGIPASTVDGSLTSDDRRDRIAAFKSGDIRVLVSVDLISEGFDVPACDCAILLRPTASLSLYLQQVGRALRPSDRDAIILDCANNAAQHGLPCEPREWSLMGIAPKSRGDLVAIPARMCPECFAVHRPAPTCPYCGHVHASSPTKLPKEIKADLQEVDPEQTARAKKDKRSEVGRARTLEELLEIARQRGYKPGWAHAVMKCRASR